MTSPRLRALEDLYEVCRGLRDDPTAERRIIERVEELDRLAPPRKPPPRPAPSEDRYAVVLFIVWLMLALSVFALVAIVMILS